MTIVSYLSATARLYPTVPGAPKQTERSIRSQIGVVIETGCMWCITLTTSIQAPLVPRAAPFFYSGGLRSGIWIRASALTMK